MTRQRKGDQKIPTQDERSVDVTSLIIRDVKSNEGFYITPVIEAVVKDLEERNALGIERYGTPLMTFNGRDSLRDLYEEVLDATKYAKQNTLEAGKTHSLIYWELLGILFRLKEAQTPTQPQSHN